MSRTAWKYHARQGEESPPQAQTPVQDQRNAVWPAARNSGVRTYGQCELHRRWLLGIRLLRVPNAMVLEHADEFVREVVEAIQASVEKARK